MKLNLIMTISASNQLRRTFSTKVPIINSVHFHKISPKPLIQSHTIHKFASKNEDFGEGDAHCFQDLESVMNVRTLTKGDPSLEKKLKMILLEIQNYQDDYLRIPYQLNWLNYKILLNLPTEELRRNYLMELMNYYGRSKWFSEKPMRKLDVNKPGHIWYRCDRNAVLKKIYPEEEETMMSPIACGGMMYGKDIIIDLSYEDNMEVNEMSLVSEALKSIYFFNQIAHSSFNIHLCNVKKDGKLLKLFRSMYNRTLDDLVINIHENSYLDVFDREKLVYLSSHAPDEVVGYNSEHIYIIGGVFDKYPFNHPYSYNKALSENIMVRRFPFDEALNWRRGSKTLGMYLSFKIISDFSYYKNWEQALKRLDLKYVENHSYMNKVGQYRNIMTALENMEKVK